MADSTMAFATIMVTSADTRYMFLFFLQSLPPDYDDVIVWEGFMHYLTFVREIHRRGCCLCVCVCACVRACVRARVCVSLNNLLNKQSIFHWLETHDAHVTSQYNHVYMGCELHHECACRWKALAIVMNMIFLESYFEVLKLSTAHLLIKKARQIPRNLAVHRVLTLETKYPSACRWPFQIHFLQCELLNFYANPLQ